MTVINTYLALYCEKIEFMNTSRKILHIQKMGCWPVREKGKLLRYKTSFATQVLRIPTQQHSASVRQSGIRYFSAWGEIIRERRACYKCRAENRLA